MTNRVLLYVQIVCELHVHVYHQPIAIESVDSGNVGLG